MDSTICYIFLNKLLKINDEICYNENTKIFLLKEITKMKQFGWIKALILNVVTFGLYSLYMWHTMTKNNNKIAEKCGEKKIKGLIAAILLSFITCGIYYYVWMFKFHALQVKIANANDAKVTPTKNAFVLLILTFIPIYSFYMLCTNYNNTVAKAA